MESTSFMYMSSNCMPYIAAETAQGPKLGLSGSFFPGRREISEENDHIHSNMGTHRCEALITSESTSTTSVYNLEMYYTPLT